MFTLEVNSPKKINILLAEDCKDSQEIFCEVLKKTGADITCVNNGKECLDAALEDEKTSSKFDLIVMDVQMPIMDGHTTARTLRENGFRKPIISMTARSGPNDSEDSKNAGCTSHVSKLSGMKGLLSAVEKEISNIKKSSIELPVLPLVPETLRENTEYAKLALNFISTLDSKIQELENLIEYKDFTNIISLTYALGNISMYGYTKFSMIINEIQLAAEKNDIEKVKSKFKLLLQEKRAIIEGVPYIKKIARENNSGVNSSGANS